MKNLQNYDFLFENFTEIIGSLLESKSKLEEVNCELSKMSRELMKINYKNLYNEGEGHCGFKLISSSSNGIKKYITQPSAFRYIQKRNFILNIQLKASLSIRKKWLAVHSNDYAKSFLSFITWIEDCKIYINISKLQNNKRLGLIAEEFTKNLVNNMIFCILKGESLKCNLPIIELFDNKWEKGEEVSIVKVYDCINTSFITYIMGQDWLTNIHSRTSRIIKNFLALYIYTDNKSVPYGEEMRNCCCFLWILSKPLYSNFVDNTLTNTHNFITVWLLYCNALCKLYSYLVTLLDLVSFVSKKFITPVSLTKIKLDICQKLNIDQTQKYFLSLNVLIKDLNLSQFIERLEESEKKMLKQFLYTLINNEKILDNKYKLLSTDLKYFATFPCITIHGFNQILDDIRKLHQDVTYYSFPIDVDYRNNSLSLEKLVNHKFDPDILFAKDQYDNCLKDLNYFKLNNNLIFVDFDEVSQNYVVRGSNN